MYFEALIDLHNYFKDKGLTLSVAESCTGGYIAHLLTSVPGASKFFYGGIVTYFTECKIKVLGVSKKTIELYGVVSEETALEMAEKVRALMGTDYAFSTTGNLGPEVLEGKDAGLVFFGFSGRELSYAKKSKFSGTREEIKEKASIYAIRSLMELIS